MSDSLMLSSLPLFPIDKVLFPAGSLSLRVTDTRYRDMMARCAGIGAPFGVVSRAQAPGATVLDNAALQDAFHPVGTLARLAPSSAASGSGAIQWIGIQRFRIASVERLRQGLWIANVSPLANDTPQAVPERFQSVSAALQNLIDSLLSRKLPPTQMPLQPPYRMDDCGWVANRWCELLPMPLDQKRRYLDIDSPLLRLELVSEALARSGIASASPARP